jgi:hypothetical protein
MRLMVFFFFLLKIYDVTYQLKLKIKNLTHETHVSFFLSFLPSICLVRLRILKYKTKPKKLITLP